MNLETFKFEIDSDGIALASFDVPGRSMNTLTTQVIKDFVALSAEVSSNDEIKGIRHYCNAAEI